MSVPLIQSGYAPTLGASITNVSTSLTLSADSGDNGHVWMLIDNEVLDGDKSGTTVSGLNRASEKYNGVASAASHSTGATVYFILGRGLAQANFPTKIDEASGADFPVASITFPNHIAALPTNFRHLEIVYEIRDSSGGTTFGGLQIQFNADGAANYTYGQIYNSSTTVAAYSEATAQTSGIAGLVVSGAAAANFFGKGRILIPNYASATNIKGWEGNTSGTYGTGGSGTQARQAVGVWNSVAAITSVKLFPASGNIAANSVITLYGLP